MSVRVFAPVSQEVFDVFKRQARRDHPESDETAMALALASLTECYSKSEWWHLEHVPRVTAENLRFIFSNVPDEVFYKALVRAKKDNMRLGQVMTALAYFYAYTGSEVQT